MAKLHKPLKYLSQFEFNRLERKFHIKEINKYSCAELTRRDYRILL
jgi:hypothetical protein